MGVVLRRYEPEDVPKLHEAARESVPSMHPWMPWCHPGYEESEARIWIEEQIKAFDAGTAYEFVISDASGRFLGGCGVNQIDNMNRRGNLGYWVRSSEAGKGIATEAVRLLREWALGNTSLVRLEVVVAVDNATSRRVAEKSGAHPEGIARSRLFLHGVSHDACVFSFSSKPK